MGNLYQPVFAGEIQNRGLGMDVDIFNEKGFSIKNAKGELVCKKPFPSMPVKFWNDDNNKKYRSSYFNKYKNIWQHFKLNIGLRSFRFLSLTGMFLREEYEIRSRGERI